MAVYLAYYTPDFSRWVRAQLAVPADAFCVSKQVVVRPQAASVNKKQESRQELRRRQLKGDLCAEAGFGMCHTDSLTLCSTLIGITST